MNARQKAVLDRFGDAAVANSWRGSRPPEDRDAIIDEYNTARAAAVDMLRGLNEIAEELTAQYEAGAEPITDAAKKGA